MGPLTAPTTEPDRTDRNTNAHACTRGPLISIEGITGVGKTYLTDRALETFEVTAVLLARSPSAQPRHPTRPWEKHCCGPCARPAPATRSCAGAPPPPKRCC